MIWIMACFVEKVALLFSRTPYNVPGCNGFLVTAFSSTCSVRSLTEIVYYGNFHSQIGSTPKLPLSEHPPYAGQSGLGWWTYTRQFVAVVAPWSASDRATTAPPKSAYLIRVQRHCYVTSILLALRRDVPGLLAMELGSSEWLEANGNTCRPHMAPHR